MKRFGTDGIRGLASNELSPEFIFQIGKSIGAFLNETFLGEEITVCIGRDTRSSGKRIEKNLVDGLNLVGVNSVLLGIIPTPAVSMLCIKNNYQMGIVISASHNPAEYNGIKLFNQNGEKTEAQAEERIETFFTCPLLIQETPGMPGRVLKEINAQEEYINSVVEKYKDLDLSSYSILIDCANGATGVTSPEVFRKLGANVEAINTKNDGDSINEKCGSTFPSIIKEHLDSTKKTYDFIFSHDGDGDRVLSFTPKGIVIDGDHMITSTALSRASKDQLQNKLVVGTVMTNEGIIEYLKENGIKFHRSNVGDKYVYRDMVRLSAEVGGEQSGHLLFLDKSPTGDGLISALEFVQAILSTNFKLMEDIHNIPLYEQRLINVPVRNKNGILELPIFKKAIKEIEEKHKNARMVFRPSGTEPLFRVFVETKNRELTDQLANKIAVLIKDIEG
ncbi:MAG: phosphoglucosamine mutase [Caldisericia bacterium]|nr:phosphoglucosamine mutase [Caldisericia bacterium]